MFYPNKQSFQFSSNKDKRKQFNIDKVFLFELEIYQGSVNFAGITIYDPAE